MAKSFRPGQFPVGSPSSRAAARSLIEERRSRADMTDIVDALANVGTPMFGPWMEDEDGSFTRRSQIPPGMTFEEAMLAASIAPIQCKGEYTLLIIDI